jgi:hypothetical protein
MSCLQHEAPQAPHCDQLRQPTASSQQDLMYASEAILECLLAENEHLRRVVHNRKKGQ